MVYYKFCFKEYDNAGCSLSTIQSSTSRLLQRLECFGCDVSRLVGEMVSSAGRARERTENKGRKLEDTKDRPAATHRCVGPPY